jgi:hypothetical protein
VPLCRIEPLHFDDPEDDDPLPPGYGSPQGEGAGSALVVLGVIVAAALGMGLASCDEREGAGPGPEVSATMTSERPAPIEVLAPGVALVGRQVRVAEAAGVATAEYTAYQRGVNLEFPTERTEVRRAPERPLAVGLSGDGRRVAVAGRDSEGAGVSLGVRDTFDGEAAGGDVTVRVPPQALTASSYADVDVSESGQTVAVALGATGGDVTVVVRYGSGLSRTVAVTGLVPGSLTVSPDGTLLAYARRPPGRAARTEVVGATGRGTSVVLPVACRGRVAFDPGGRRFLCRQEGSVLTFTTGGRRVGTPLPCEDPGGRGPMAVWAAGSVATCRYSGGTGLLWSPVSGPAFVHSLGSQEPLAIDVDPESGLVAVGYRTAVDVVSLAG